MATPTLDNDLFPYAQMSLDMVGVAIEGGRSQSGVTQAIDFSGGGFWKLECRQLQILSVAQHLYLNKMAAYLNGSTRTVYVPLHTEYIEPASPLSAAVIGAHALGATTMILEVQGGIPLSGGEIFSINHPTMAHRAYRISEIQSTVSDLQTVTISPPLRQAMTPPTDGTAVDFSNPKVTMRLMAGTTIPWEVRDWWVANPTVVFVEAFGAI